MLGRCATDNNEEAYVTVAPWPKFRQDHHEQRSIGSYSPLGKVQFSRLEMHPNAFLIYAF